MVSYSNLNRVEWDIKSFRKVFEPSFEVLIQLVNVREHTDSLPSAESCITIQCDLLVQLVDLVIDKHVVAFGWNPDDVNRGIVACDQVFHDFNALSLFDTIIRHNYEIPVPCR